MALNTGSRLHVPMPEVFPGGCYLMPNSIVEAQDWDEVTRVRTPAVDKLTGSGFGTCASWTWTRPWRADPARWS